jgi:tripartite-type tricarboxylate transporter receptor subunit TctC
VDSNSQIKIIKINHGGFSMKNLTRLSSCLASIVLLLSASIAQAAFPDKPVTLIVPFKPGGSNDIVARQLGKQLSADWGQPVVIENKPGAGSDVGSAYTASQKADGYTIQIASVTFTMRPAIIAKQPFDAQNDFTRIALVGQSPLMLGVRPGAPADNAKDYFEYLRSKPGQLSYGATGVGSIQHFAGEILRKAIGSDIQAVQYKGGAPAMKDVMGDHIEFSIGSLTQMLPPYKAGQIKGLAVTSATRSESAPEIPTLQEVGVDGYEIVQWWGILGPKGIPGDIVNTLNSSINKVLKTSEFKEALAKKGSTPRPMSVPEFSAWMDKNFSTWIRVAKEQNIKK